MLRRKKTHYSNNSYNPQYSTYRRRRRNWWPLIRFILAIVAVVAIITVVIVLIVTNANKKPVVTPTVNPTQTTEPVTQPGDTDETKEPPVVKTHELVSGGDTTIYLSTYTLHTFKFNIDPSDIKSITIDEIPVKDTDYITSNLENTILLSNDCLKDLSLTSHIVHFDFKVDSVDTTLTVSQALPLPEDTNRKMFSDIIKAYGDDAVNNNSWFFASLKSVNESGYPTFNWDRSNDLKNAFNTYNGIYYKSLTEKKVYLTFDCGYENGYTNSILDTLKEKNIKAIFFVTGSYVSDSSNKSILQRMVKEGHLIGNHTDTHKNMSSLTDEEFIAELNNCQLKLNEALGYEYQTKFYRPPEGSTCERDLIIASRLGYSTVLWSYAYGDYNPDNQPDEAESLVKAEASLYNGSVYLLHAISRTNTNILGSLIDYMVDQGYQICRIDN